MAGIFLHSLSDAVAGPVWVRYSWAAIATFFLCINLHYTGCFWLGALAWPRCQESCTFFGDYSRDLETRASTDSHGNMRENWMFVSTDLYLQGGHRLSLLQSCSQQALFYHVMIAMIVHFSNGGPVSLMNFDATLGFPGDKGPLPQRILTALQHIPQL